MAEVEALGDSLGEDLAELMFFCFRVAVVIFLMQTFSYMAPSDKPTAKT